MAKKSSLDHIESPLPCANDWNEMIGDERVRFCHGCEKNVYNLSAMTRREAGKFVARNSGKVCVRYVRLPDGKVETLDTKLYKITRRASQIAAGVFGATLTLATIANAQTPEKPQTAPTETVKSQNNSETSRISFTVYDLTDAPIQSAEVRLTNLKTKEVFIVFTDENGVAYLNLIPHGRYEVELLPNGFQPWKRVVQIREQIEPNIKVHLEVGRSEFVGVVIDSWSEIPLFLAIAQKDNKTVKNLIDSGFKVNTKDEDGNTALHVAVANGNLEVISFLLERGAKLNIKNKHKLTPIWMFEEDDEATNSQIFRLLIAKGADVNVPNENNETLLMMACSDDNLEAVKILLEAGANPQVRDEDSETAIEKTDSDEIKALLKKYGAKE